MLPRRSWAPISDGSTPPHNSQTPTGFPAVQLHSDMIYPETVPDGRKGPGEGLSPTGLFLPPFRPQSQVHVITWASDWLAIGGRFQRPPPSLVLINRLELTELRATSALLEGLLQEHPDEELHMTKLSSSVQISMLTSLVLSGFCEGFLT